MTLNVQAQNRGLDNKIITEGEEHGYSQSKNKSKDKTKDKNRGKSFDISSSDDATDSTYSGYSTPSNQISSGTDTITLRQLRTNGECYTGFNGAEFIVTNGATGVATYKQEVTDFGCQAGRVGSVATSSTVPVSTITWKCLGDNGGNNVNCFAKVVAPINGECSGLNGKVYQVIDSVEGLNSAISEIKASGCTNGTFYNLSSSSTTPPSTIKWSCIGEYEGSTSNCAATVKTTPIDGKCKFFLYNTTGIDIDNPNSQLFKNYIDYIYKNSCKYGKISNLTISNIINSTCRVPGYGNSIASTDLADCRIRNISYQCVGENGGSTDDCTRRVSEIDSANNNNNNNCLYGYNPNGCGYGD